MALCGRLLRKRSRRQHMTTINHSRPRLELQWQAECYTAKDQPVPCIQNLMNDTFPCRNLAKVEKCCERGELSRRREDLDCLWFGANLRQNLPWRRRELDLTRTEDTRKSSSNPIIRPSITSLLSQPQHEIFECSPLSVRGFCPQRQSAWQADMRSWQLGLGAQIGACALSFQTPENGFVGFEF